MPKFLKPRGTIDIFDNEANVYQNILDTCKQVANNFNFKQIITPTFESSNLYTRATGETSDIVSKEMYDFKDKKGRDITLRPEGTAGVIRAIVENKLYAINDLPLKYYYSGSFFRYERPQVGRYREFMQFGVEMVGSNNYLDDIESIMLIVAILKKLKINDYKIRINTFGNEMCRNIHRDNIKNFFTPHVANLCEDCKVRYEKNPLRILDCKVDAEYISKLDIPVSLNSLDEKNLQEFNEIVQILKDNNINVEVDKYLVRGLDYYTGLIYEVDVTLKDGKTLTIGGGGRYSALVKELEGPDLSCVGFGLGVNRLALVLIDLYSLEAFANVASFYIMPFNSSVYNVALQIASALRENNHNVVIETNSKSISSMFKYASKHHFKYALMLGDDEIKEKQVKVKNLETQEQFYVKIEDILGGKFNG